MHRSKGGSEGSRPPLEIENLLNLNLHSKIITNMPRTPPWQTHISFGPPLEKFSGSAHVIIKFNSLSQYLFLSLSFLKNKHNSTFIIVANKTMIFWICRLMASLSRGKRMVCYNYVLLLMHALMSTGQLYLLFGTLMSECIFLQFVPKYLLLWGKTSSYLIMKNLHRVHLFCLYLIMI